MGEVLSLSREIEKRAYRRAAYDNGRALQSVGHRSVRLFERAAHERQDARFLGELVGDSGRHAPYLICQQEAIGTANADATAFADQLRADAANVARGAIRLFRRGVRHVLNLQARSSLEDHSAKKFATETEDVRPQ